MFDLAERNYSTVFEKCFSAYRTDLLTADGDIVKIQNIGGLIFHEKYGIMFYRIIPTTEYGVFFA